MGWLLDCDAIEMVTNGGFDADTDWIHDPQWSIAGGKATKAFFPQNPFTIWQFLPLTTPAKPYWFQFDIDFLDIGTWIELFWHDLFIDRWFAIGRKTALFPSRDPLPGRRLVFNAGLNGAIMDNVSVTDIGATVACSLGLIVSETARYEVTERTPPYIEVKIADPAHSINVLTLVNTDDF